MFGLLAVQAARSGKDFLQRTTESWQNVFAIEQVVGRYELNTAVEAVYARDLVLRIDYPDQSGAGIQPVTHAVEKLAGPISGRNDFYYEVGNQSGISRAANLRGTVDRDEGHIGPAHRIRIRRDSKAGVLPKQQSAVATVDEFTEQIREPCRHFAVPGARRFAYDEAASHQLDGPPGNVDAQQIVCR